MLESLLIANRGEIACRIIRTARRLGVRTVAVHSEADRGALHARLADEAIEIGPAEARLSYLDMDRILRAARDTRATAIHPGYGFLSENATFARACADAGVVFVGPPVVAIERMGSKSEARLLMAAAGVPVLPGYDGEDQTDGVLEAEAARLGFPLLVKPTAGGGGKGMRVVRAAGELAAALAGARREAAKAFGDPRLLLERFVEKGRHVEIQVFADRHGDTVHLFERDCSLQRRHQKVIEEAPAPGLDHATREAMGAGGRRGGACRGLRRRRHGRVPLRRRQLLLPRDEHPAAGGAPGHRDDHRARPGRMAAARRRRRAAAVVAGAGDAARPRGRGAAVCGGPRARLPALHGPDRTTALPRRARAPARGRRRAARATRSPSTTTR